MAAPIPLFDFSGYDTVGKDNELWLNIRRHGPDFSNPASPDYIPYTVGGSDVAVIFGVSPWKTNLELWLEKKGRYTPPPTTSANRHRLWEGHQLEPVVAATWERMTGNRVQNDEHIYQHSDFRWALADFDRRFITPMNVHGILECKSCSWRVRDHWADGKYPLNYELQLRFYLSVADVDLGAFGALWGNNPAEDFAYPYMDRDKALESDIFHRLEEWIWSLENDKQPKMAFSTPKQALSALANVYAKGNPELPTLALPSKLEKNLRRIIMLQEEKKRIKADADRCDTELAYAEIAIRETMRDAVHAVLETSSDKVLIDLVTKSRRRTTVDKERLMRDFPDAASACLSESVSQSRKLSVRTEPK